MKNKRRVEEIFSNNNAHWVGNGFRVKQYFPSGRDKNFMQRFSPFLLMDYNSPYMFQGVENSKLGVGAHPHRGFETVTIVIDGKLEHGDNKGNSGVIESGDVQWMTVGSGILHKEYHEVEYAKTEHLLHCIQLWVNLPAKYKMTTPKYQSILNEEMGRYISEDNMTEVKVIAGNFEEVKGKANTFSPINMYIIDMKKDAKFEIQEPADFNIGILVSNGNVNINDKDANQGDFVLFENVDGIIEFNALTDTKVLVLSGEPLNEPIVAGGPFVMNTREELNQAMIDFRNGEFGEENF